MPRREDVWEMDVQLHAPAALPSPPLVAIEWEAGWTSEPVWTLWRKKSLYHCQESSPGGPAHSSVTILTELLRLQVISYTCICSTAGYIIYSIQNSSSYQR
jgi:hypothetical protein